MKNGKKTNKNTLTDNKDHRIVYPNKDKSLPKRDYAIFDSLDGWKKTVLVNYVNGATLNNIDGIDAVDIAVALKTDKTFKKCYDLARKINDAVELMALERVSTENALKPSSITERIFRLKSLNRDRYADRGRVQADVDININFGNGVNAYDVSTANKISKEIKTSNNVSKESKTPDDIASIVSKIQ